MENESSLLKKILAIASVIGLIGLLGYLFWVIFSGSSCPSYTMQ